MNKNPPIIIFGSNTKSSSASAKRLHQLENIANQSYTKPNNTHDTIQPVFAYTTEDIFDALEKYKDRLLAFHFEGRSENYDKILAASHKHNIRNLSDYLGTIQKIGYVFLSGCAREKYINALLNRGIPAVITSSKRLSDTEILFFAETIHQELGKGKSIEDAYRVAKESLGVIEGQGQRIFINLRGLLPARRWTLPPKIIGDFEPTIIGEQTQKNNTEENHSVNISNEDVTTSSNLDGATANSATIEHGIDDDNNKTSQTDGMTTSSQVASTESIPSIKPGVRKSKRTNYTRKSPFVGSRPFSKDDTDVFFGRDAEVETLLDWVTNPGKPAFILLAGAAGVGKTSLIQAGLIPQLEMLDKKPVVYEFSAATDPSLFGKLREKLREDSGIDEPFEAWKEIECKQNRQIILIVDDIGIPFMRPFPGQYAEFPKLLTGLVPIFSDNTFGPKGKVLLSVRNYKVNDVLQQCQNNGFVFDQFPLPRLDGNNLKNAIYRPFQAGSLEQVQIEDEVIAKIFTEIQRDSASPGLAYMQEIVLRLWRHAKRSNVDAPKITLENYQWLHTQANLLDCFLEKQLQDIRTNLSNKFSIQQILQFLDFHYDAYNQPISRSNNERSRRFPTIPAKEMRELLVELTQHRLLIHSPGNEKGRLQIGHSTLAVHANARLIAEKQAAMKPARVRKYYQSGSINDDICDTEPSESHMHGDMNNIANTRNNDPAHVIKCDSHSTNEIPLHESCHQSPNHPPFGNANYENSTKWKHINIQLIELALMIAVVMAIVLFGVLLLGLTLDGSSYVNPYVINLESNVSIDK